MCLGNAMVAYTDSAHTHTTNLSPNGAFMKVGGVSVPAGNPGCLTFNGGGSALSINCDGTRFQNGNPYYGLASGSFTIQVYLLNP